MRPRRGIKKNLKPKGVIFMGKPKDAKKEEKKKPLKTLKEKRNEKQEKKKKPA